MPTRPEPDPQHCGKVAKVNWTFTLLHYFVIFLLSCLSSLLNYIYVASLIPRTHSEQVSHWILVKRSLTSNYKINVKLIHLAIIFCYLSISTLPTQLFVTGRKLWVGRKPVSFIFSFFTCVCELSNSKAADWQGDERRELKYSKIGTKKEGKFTKIRNSPSLKYTSAEYVRPSVPGPWIFFSIQDPRIRQFELRIQTRLAN